MRSQRKRISGSFAINAVLPSHSVFGTLRHCEHARGTKRVRDFTEPQLSARHTICLQAEHLDPRLNRHLAGRGPWNQTIRVKHRDHVLQLCVELRGGSVRFTHCVRSERYNPEVEAQRPAVLLPHRDDQVLHPRDTSAENTVLHRIHKERLVAGQCYCIRYDVSN